MKSSRNFSASVFLITTLFLNPASPAQTTSSPSPSLSRQTFSHELSDAALERTNHIVRYDSAYVRISYPGGDVPANTGVCSDEVIRSYRALGIDLQKLVHEDMAAHFKEYPNQARWQLSHTDTNIDHRRVPNLMVFFSRRGKALPVSTNRAEFNPGDLVTWDLGGGVPHIGIVVEKKSSSGHCLIVHNIGEGPKAEDVLFNWRITGHYRYYGPQLESNTAGT